MRISLGRWFNSDKADNVLSFGREVRGGEAKCRENRRQPQEGHDRRRQQLPRPSAARVGGSSASRHGTHHGQGAQGRGRAVRAGSACVPWWSKGAACAAGVRYPGAAPLRMLASVRTAAAHCSSALPGVRTHLVCARASPCLACLRVSRSTAYVVRPSCFASLLRASKEKLEKEGIDPTASSLLTMRSTI